MKDYIKMTTTFKMTMYHEWEEPLDLGADSILACLPMYRRLLDYLWFRITYSLESYAKLLAYVSQIVSLGCHFNYGITIVLYFVSYIAWNHMLNCLSMNHILLAYILTLTHPDLWKHKCI